MQAASDLQLHETLIGSLPIRRAVRACPACGTNNHEQPESRWSVDFWILKRCSRCDFLYLENPPDLRELTDQFRWERTYRLEASRRRKQEPLLHALGRARVALAAWLVERRRGGKIYRWIERYVGPGRLLDVGCGGGALFDLLPPEIIPFGVEISPYLAYCSNENARPRGGYVVEGAASTAMSVFGTGYFDGIVMRTYLEHEIEPSRVLKISARILRPGGSLIIKVPNFDSWNRRIRQSRWCGFRFPDHVNYFTPRSLVRMITAAGLEVARFRWTDRLPTNDNMWLVARKPTAPLVSD